MPRCRNCQKKFEIRFTSFEKYCWDPECKTKEAMIKLKKIKEAERKRQKKELLQRKRDLETIQQMIKRVQKVVNRYVRLRDSGKTCISCHRKLKGKFDAGHYHPAGQSFGIRFDAERNIFGQCVHCNRWKHGALNEYRKSLIKMFGSDAVEQLDQEAKIHKKWTKHELQEVLDHYKKAIKILQENK